MHDLVNEPPVEHAEEALGYAQRDPRAGQGIDEHKVHVTMLEDERGQRLWPKEFTLPELADAGADADCRQTARACGCSSWCNSARRAMSRARCALSPMR